MNSPSAKRYWEERLTRFPSARGTGHRRFGVEYNRLMYQIAADCLDDLIDEFNISLGDQRILDVGTGMGFLVDYYHERGVTAMWGIDITEASARHLSVRYPDSTFLVADVGAQALPFTLSFDLISAFGVLYHVVDDDRFAQALANLCVHLDLSGYLLIVGSFRRSLLPTAGHTKLRPLTAFRPVLDKHGVRIRAIVPLYYTLGRGYVPWIGPRLLSVTGIPALLARVDARLRRMRFGNGSNLKMLLAQKAG